MANGTCSKIPELESSLSNSRATVSRDRFCRRYNRNQGLNRAGILTINDEFRDLCGGARSCVPENLKHRSQLPVGFGEFVNIEDDSCIRSLQGNFLILEFSDTLPLEHGRRGHLASRQRFATATLLLCRSIGQRLIKVLLTSQCDVALRYNCAILSMSQSSNAWQVRSTR